jgi:hypothetical protein
MEEKIICDKCGKEFIKHQRSHYIEYVDDNTIWCEFNNCIFNHVTCDID